MTIHEIQTTVDSLRERHHNLTEHLLTTLLQAGGWDERSCKEALVLFREGGTSDKQSPDAYIATEKQLPAPHDMLLEQPVHEKVVAEIEEVPQEISSHVEVVIDEEQVQQTEQPHLPEGDFSKTKEPENASAVSEVQSLVFLDNVPEKKEDVTGLPDNLPLKPFDESSHTWSFSKYKDLFHQDVSVDNPVVYDEPLPEPVPQPEQPLTKKDEGLIFIAGVSLVFVLLILLYMYSLGRL